MLAMYIETLGHCGVAALQWLFLFSWLLLSVREYKNAMEKEKEELNHKLNDIVKEYNELAEQYNKLLDEKTEVELPNR